MYFKEFCSFSFVADGTYFSCVSIYAAPSFSLPRSIYLHFSIGNIYIENWKKKNSKTRWKTATAN